MCNVELYIIECATNMHVGSGDASFTVVDNQVERDVITNFPTINSAKCSFISILVVTMLKAYFPSVLPMQGTNIL